MTITTQSSSSCTLNICLVDFKWRGHHTPYAKLLVDYLIKRGHNVTFITSSNHARLSEFSDHEALQIIRIQTGLPRTLENISPALFGQIKRSMQFLKSVAYTGRGNYDVIHFLCIDYHEIPFNLFTALNFRIKVPVVATLHRDHFLDEDGEPLRGVKKKFARKSLSLAMNRGSIAKLVVHHGNIQNRLIRAIRVSETLIECVPCPTRELDNDMTQAEARARLELPTKGKIFLFFGELRHDKGIDILISAARNLSNEDIAVVIAGPEIEYTESDIDEMIGQEDGIVKRCGFVREELVEIYLIASDVLVLPYRRSKGISGPLRLASMANVPVIGSDDSDIGDIIESNDIGQTFERGSVTSLQEAMTHFIEQDEGFPSTEMRKYQTQIHWETAGFDIESIYLDVLSVER